jgi:hypothetical protein
LWLVRDLGMLWPTDQGELLGYNPS